MGRSAKKTVPEQGRIKGVGRGPKNARGRPRGGPGPPLIITGVGRPPLLWKDSRFFQANIAPFYKHFQLCTKHIHTNFQVQEKIFK